MFVIQLNNLEFFAHHGIHEEERILGNSFIVNLRCSLKTYVDGVNKIEETVNYVSVYDIVKKRMAIPTPLLETVAKEIADEIAESDKRIQRIAVSIEKKGPPVAGMQGSVAVQYLKGF